MKHPCQRHLSLSSILSGLIALLLSLQVSTGLAEDAKLPKELSPEAAEAVKKAIEEAEARAKGVDPEKAQKQAAKEAKARADKAAAEKAHAEKEASKLKAQAEKEAKARAKIEKEEAEKLAKSKAEAKAEAPAKTKADKKTDTAKTDTTKTGPKVNQPGPRFEQKHAGSEGDFSDGRLTTGVLLGEVIKGNVDLLIPMFDSGTGGVLFLDPRFTADDDEAQQLAVGLGWRQHLAGRDLIVGGNIFYDSVWTEGDAQFNQLGFGLELLSALIDARFNYYLPEDEFDGDKPSSSGSRTSSSAASTPSSSSSAAASSFGDTVFPGGAKLAGATVFPGGSTISSSSSGSSSVASNPDPSFEGFDAEIGIKLPIDQIPETRLFAGVQMFDNALGGDDFEGFVGRVEVRPTPGVTVDLQYFTEEELNQNANWFAGVRLNLPFSLAELARGRNPFAGSSSVFQGADRSFDSRMYEYLIRNPQ